MKKLKNLKGLQRSKQRGNGNGLLKIYFWNDWLRKQELLTSSATTFASVLRCLRRALRIKGRRSKIISSLFRPKALERKNQPDWMTVAEIQSRDDLPEELPGLFRSQSAFLHQVVKQLSSWHMLQYQVPAYRENGVISSLQIIIVYSRSATLSIYSSSCFKYFPQDRSKPLLV